MLHNEQLIVFPVHVCVRRLKKIQQKKKIIRERAEKENKLRLAALEAEGGGRGGRAGDESKKNKCSYVVAVVLNGVMCIFSCARCKDYI